MKGILKENYTFPFGCGL